MKISTKGRYALRMMLDLAEHRNEGYVTLKDIAQRQGISKKYLEQIVPLLNKADILRANRGYKGGYTLVKEPSEYTVGDILRIAEGSLAPVSCVDGVECARCDNCMTIHVWQGLDQVITEYLDGITLQDILDDYKNRSCDDYSI